MPQSSNSTGKPTSRRSFLQLSILGGISALLTACGYRPNEPTANDLVVQKTRTALNTNPEQYQQSLEQLRNIPQLFERSVYLSVQTNSERGEPVTNFGAGYIIGESNTYIAVATVRHITAGAQKIFITQPHRPEFDQITASGKAKFPPDITNPPTFSLFQHPDNKDVVIIVIPKDQPTEQPILTSAPQYYSSSPKPGTVVYGFSWPRDTTGSIEVPTFPLTGRIDAEPYISDTAGSHGTSGTVVVDANGVIVGLITSGKDKTTLRYIPIKEILKINYQPSIAQSP